VLFDAVVLPGGASAVEAMVANGIVLEFVKDQFRHCKPILALGDASRLLDAAGIPPALPTGEPDPGVLRAEAVDDRTLQAFGDAIARHRHYGRETDPPSV